MFNDTATSEVYQHLNQHHYQGHIFPLVPHPLPLLIVYHPPHPQNKVTQGQGASGYLHHKPPQALPRAPSPAGERVTGRPTAQAEDRGGGQQPPEQRHVRSDASSQAFHTEEEKLASLCS